MADSLGLSITGVGALSPVGLSAPATCAALRAGLARLTEVNSFLVDGELIGNEPAVGGRVPTEWFRGGPAQPEWPGHDRLGAPEPPAPETIVESGSARLVELAVPAAAEAWADAGRDHNPPESYGIWIGADPADAQQLPFTEIVRELGVEPVVTQAEPHGRAAFFAAFRAAAKALRAGEVQVALVGGVDSLIRRERLAALDAAGIVRSFSRPDGVLVGEAAAFVVLEATPAAAARGADRAHVESIVLDEEPTAGTDDPNQAKGLTRVLRKTFGAPQEKRRPFPLAVCDLNGDRYRAIEWTMASLRALPDRSDDLVVWHAADCVGDTGAASGALALVWTVTSFDKGYAPKDEVLVWGASDGPLRAATLLTPPTAN